MIKILSYGGGINSTAILALVKLGKYKMPDRIIFCDTGAERSQTYCYLRYISKLFPIEIIKSELGSLVDYCFEKGAIPSIVFRWCTDKFKIRPFKKACPEEHVKILGISAEEQHRVKDGAAEYPLIEMGIDRTKCVELIKEAGLEIPIKSGCFICPQMRMKEVDLLRKQFPDQFKTLCEMEINAHSRNPKIYWKNNGKFILEYCNDRQTDFIDEITGFEDYQNCLCKYD